MEIAAAESFASMVVEPGQALKIAATDMEAYFYQCALPPGLASYFHLGSLDAAEALSIGVERFDGGESLKGSEGVCKVALAVLPIGWSWAFWLMQGVHLNLVVRAGFPAQQVALAGGAPLWPRDRVRSRTVTMSPSLAMTLKRSAGPAT